MNENAHDTWSGVSLSAKRGEKLVFSNLEFNLISGDALLLKGSNGFGKSTLLRLMAGLGHPQSGYLLWNSENIKIDQTAHSARLNYIGHLTGVKLALNVEEDLGFWMKLKGIYDYNAIKIALTHFELYHQRTFPSRFLSSGQKRKLALARLMVLRSKIWLLDEPTVGLDRNGIQALEEIIKEQRTSNGIVVVASHSEIGLGKDIKRLDLTTYQVGNSYVDMEY
jgi:heme exporter protein A